MDTALKRGNRYTYRYYIYYNIKTICKCSYCYYFVVCLFRLGITHLSPTFRITTNKWLVFIFTWHAFCVLQYLVVAYKCNVMCFTAASNILSHGSGFILLTVAIETDNPQSKDVNSTELNVTCCHLGIMVITTWRECSIKSEKHCTIFSCPRWKIGIVAPKWWCYVVQWERFKDTQTVLWPKIAWNHFKFSMIIAQCVCCNDPRLLTSQTKCNINGT